MSKRLPLRGRDGSVHAEALVDEDVYGWASKVPWHLFRPENYVIRHRGPYARVFLHRMVLGLTEKDPRRVDHINGDRMDNRRANLRIATVAQNAQNQGSRGKTSSHRGVSWSNTRQKWLAQGTLNGRNHNLGRYDTEEEATEVAAGWRAEHMPYSEEARVA